jgi:hypothetical protein
MTPVARVRRNSYETARQTRNEVAGHAGRRDAGAENLLASIDGGEVERRRGEGERKTGLRTATVPHFF